MNGLFTLLSEKKNHTRKGLYFKSLPEARIFITNPTDLDPNATPVPFVYEVVDPESKEYRHVIQNVISGKGSTTAIKTNQDRDWRTQSYVVTMERELYTIVSVTVDTRAATPEAAGMFARPVGTEFILRLRKIENPRGIGQ